VKSERTVERVAAADGRPSVPLLPALPEPTPREPMTATIPARFRGHARRDAAAFYLSQLARGVLAGELSVGEGERLTSLATSEFVVLEIEVKQKKRANHVAVKLRWPRRPLIRIAAGRSRNGGQ
jgi:amphi-Trp domain-containing protein